MEAPRSICKRGWGLAELQEAKCRENMRASTWGTFFLHTWFAEQKVFAQLELRHATAKTFRLRLQLIFSVRPPLLFIRCAA